MLPQVIGFLMTWSCSIHSLGELLLIILVGCSSPVLLVILLVMSILAIIVIVVPVGLQLPLILVVCRVGMSMLVVAVMGMSVLATVLMALMSLLVVVMLMHEKIRVLIQIRWRCSMKRIGHPLTRHTRRRRGVCHSKVTIVKIVCSCLH